MFIYSIKASSIKFFGVVFLSVAALITLIALIPTYEPTISNTYYSEEASVNFDKIKSNEDRISFIKQFGWEVNETPTEEAKVTVPAEFDRVFTSYNELQKQQGLDLSKYKRKEVMRYTYEIKNYPDHQGTVYANILVYRNKVIGGDICTAETNGFVRGFNGEIKLP